jgi:cell division septation protein DedD
MMGAENEWNAEIRVEAREALPFERIGRESGKRRRWPRLVLWGVLAVAVAGAGAASYMKYGAMAPSRPGEVPVVHADVEPIKIRPQEPGGMDVPNRDKLIYDQMAGTASAPRVERLLPPPENPRALPTPAPAAANPNPASVIPTAETPTERDVAAIAAPPQQAAPKPLTATPLARDPSLASVPPSAAAAAPAARPEAGFRIQIAAARTPDAAEQEWSRLSRQHKDLLGDLDHWVNATDLGDKGIFHRLRAGPVKDRAAAEDLCNQLKQRNVGCLIVRPE